MIAWATVAVKNTSALGSGRATMNWLPTMPREKPDNRLRKAADADDAARADGARSDDNTQRARGRQRILRQSGDCPGNHPCCGAAAERNVDDRDEDEVDESPAGCQEARKGRLQRQRDDDHERDACRLHEPSPRGRRRRLHHQHLFQPVEFDRRTHANGLVDAVAVVDLFDLPDDEALGINTVDA